MKIPNTNPGKEEEKEDQGFTRVSSMKWGRGKHDNQEVNKKITVSNKFKILDGVLEKTLDKEPVEN